MGDQSVALGNIPEVVSSGDAVILVLGNEGHGMRTNIVRRCDHLVSIQPVWGDADPAVSAPNGLTAITGSTHDSDDSGEIAAMEHAVDEDNDSDDGAVLDSLNVSVAGGILMHHLLAWLRVKEIGK